MRASTAARNLRTLERIAKHFGIDILSSTRVDPGQRERFDLSIRELSASLQYAVVLGMRLSGPVLETVINAPTWTYYHHYRTVNFALDQAALHLAGECQRLGCRALPIPASQILDWNKLRGHLSHWELGAHAGLGWRCRNNLLVHHEYGSQVRYATVLTDLPLPDRREPTPQGDCGDCYRCVAVCPVSAISEDPYNFNLDTCTAQIRRFSKSEKLNALICGLCVRVCQGSMGVKLQGEGSARE